MDSNVKKYKHSSIDAKKFTDFDIEYLNRLVIHEYDRVASVLNNERYYSDDTIKMYKKMKDSLNRISSSFTMKYKMEVVDEIPRTWN